MATTHKGSCSCGAVKLEVQGDPLFVGLCHCYTCQKSTSSAYSTNWVVPRPAFKVVSGEAKVYETKGGSGNPVSRNFCGACSSTMWTESGMRPDLVIVKAGIIDDGGIAKFTPASESFTSRKPTWVKSIEEAKQFVEGYA